MERLRGLPAWPGTRAASQSGLRKHAANAVEVLLHRGKDVFLRDGQCAGSVLRAAQRILEVNLKGTVERRLRHHAEELRQFDDAFADGLPLLAVCALGILAPHEIFDRDAAQVVARNLEAV